MKLSPSGLLAHAKSDEGRKQLRYLGVSVVFVPVGQILIQVLGILFDGNYVAASLVNAAILTLPNFYANKRWVWRITSKENQRTQIAVFWVAAMLGVTFATGLTWIVQQATQDSSKLVTALSVTVAQLTGFGIVWVLRYLVLDRWLFKVTHHGAEPTTPEELGEIDDLRGEIPI